VSGLAWAAPVNGRILAGATFEAGEDVRPGPRADDSNLRRLARMLADDENEASAFARAWADSLQTASHGVRWTSPDRLPMIGVMPDEAGIRARAHELARNGRLPLPLLPGLYGTFGFGARGTLWAALAGVCLPAMAIGAPPPIEADLLRAIDPVRPLQRLIRKYYQ
jgi:tRNA 5-methylaminomethyl-2-thiouridine biosynthesis bifunctional protein